MRVIYKRVAHRLYKKIILALDIVIRTPGSIFAFLSVKVEEKKRRTKRNQDNKKSAWCPGGAGLLDCLVQRDTNILICRA